MWNEKLGVEIWKCNALDVSFKVFTTKLKFAKIEKKKFLKNTKTLKIDTNLVTGYPSFVNMLYFSRHLI